MWHFLCHKLSQHFLKATSRILKLQRQANTFQNEQENSFSRQFVLRFSF